MCARGDACPYADKGCAYPDSKPRYGNAETACCRGFMVLAVLLLGREAYSVSFFKYRDYVTNLLSERLAKYETP